MIWQNRQLYTLIQVSGFLFLLLSSRLLPKRLPYPAPSPSALYWSLPYFTTTKPQLSHKFSDIAMIFFVHDILNCLCESKREKCCMVDRVAGAGRERDCVSFVSFDRVRDKEIIFLLSTCHRHAGSRVHDLFVSYMDTLGILLCLCFLGQNLLIMSCAFFLQLCQHIPH